MAERNPAKLTEVFVDEKSAVCHNKGEKLRKEDREKRNCLAKAE